MSFDKALPALMIIESFGAAVIYFASGKMAQSIYWIAAGVLTTTVTFFMK